MEGVVSKEVWADSELLKWVWWMCRSRQHELAAEVAAPCMTL